MSENCWQRLYSRGRELSGDACKLEQTALLFSAEAGRGLQRESWRL